jgi:hypothetical protein
LAFFLSSVFFCFTQRFFISNTHSSPKAFSLFAFVSTSFIIHQGPVLWNIHALSPGINIEKLYKYTLPHKKKEGSRQESLP